MCLQELKAPDEKFPAPALREAGYGAVWHGQKSWNGVAVLARGAEPVETRRGLPGDPDDMHSRYIEAAISGLTVGCLYLPNGNPAPGPKFDYKLRWFERLTNYAQSLLHSSAPVILAGDFNTSDRSHGYRRLTGPFHDAMRRRWAGPTYVSTLWRPFLLRIDHVFMPKDWCAAHPQRFALPGSDHRCIAVTVGPCPGL